MTLKNMKQIKVVKNVKVHLPLTHTSKERITVWLFPAPEAFQNRELGTSCQPNPPPGQESVHTPPLLPVLMHLWEASDLMLFETQECSETGVNLASPFKTKQQTTNSFFFGLF